MPRSSALFVLAVSTAALACTVGAGDDPSFADGRPTMFICGNDAAAKQEVTRLCEQLGWDTEDMGQVESARAIEPLCQLWCVRGFNRNQWTHAFKLIKS